LAPALQNFRDRGSRGVVVLGRLRDGVSREQAQSDMDAISLALERAYPDTNEKRGVEVAFLSDETFDSVRPALFVLLGAVGVVLLIGCANVANLVLLRTESRQAELAIRAAVGALPRDLLKLVLAETVILSCAGAVLGVAVSTWSVDLMLALSPIQLPSFVNIRLDGTVILFAAGLASVTALFMALAPALQFAPRDLHTMLTANSTRVSHSRSTRRFRNALVIAEVALSFVLLFSAGLLMESFRQLLQVNTGFETANLLTLRVGFENQASAKALEVKQTLEALPGVDSAALTSVIPFSGAAGVFYSAEGVDPQRDPSLAPRAYIHFVSPGFFRTMRIPVRQGREFANSDGETAVIVSQKVVQRFWPNQDPIGKRIRIGRDNTQNPWLNIVGVVGNTRTRALPDNPTADPDIYMPFPMFGGAPGLVIRTAAEPAKLIPTVLDAVRQVDKLAITSTVATMEDLMRPQTARSRFLSLMSGTFSGIALALALVGIYASISYSVRQRTREMGLRIALGARRRHLLGIVLGQCLALIGAGLVLGFICSVLAGPGISSLLFGVTATAPSMFMLTSLLLIITGLGAAYVPARRASRIDPVDALRQE
jgi:putative ABC transport system permease protein